MNEEKWPKPYWSEPDEDVLVPVAGKWIHYSGQWRMKGGPMCPDHTKAETEELWEQHQKLESLTDNDLACAGLDALGNADVPRSVADLERFARAVVTADRKREEEIRGRNRPASEAELVRLLRDDLIANQYGVVEDSDIKDAIDRIRDWCKGGRND